MNLLKILCDKILTYKNLQSNSRQLRLLYSLLRSLSISPDVCKDIMKQRFIEEVLAMIIPTVKNDKDIKLCKYYLGNFSAFLSAFTSTDEGQRQILKIKQTFELTLFLINTVSIPAAQADSQDLHLSPINNLVCHILLFIRNATLDNRSNKVHFTKSDTFLPCLMDFMQRPNLHPKIKALASGVMWGLVHNHQGIKAAINKSSFISDLQLMKSDY